MRSIFLAEEEAMRRGQHCVGTEHLLLGLVRVNGGLAIPLLDRMGVPLDRVRFAVQRVAARGRAAYDLRPQLSPPAQRAVDLAREEAQQLGSSNVGTEHILIGLIRDSDCLGGRVLMKLGVRLEEARRLAREMDLTALPADGPQAVADALRRRFTPDDTLAIGRLLLLERDPPANPGEPEATTR